MAQYKCDNCGHTADEDELPDTKQLSMSLYVVCEVIWQKPAVSVHATEEDAMKHAVACAMENLYAAEDPEDPEDRKESEERLYDMLTEFDAICEGDYEVHMLLPTNRQR